MKKIEQFQITSISISGFKSYEKPTELIFGDPTVITGGNGRGKSSIADAIAFAVTGLPFFGERGLDRLHNEKNPDVAIQMRFVDENGIIHELTRIRQNNDMSIYYDGHTIRQLDLTDLFGERDVFLSILNPLYFIEELGTNGKNLLERYLPFIPQETILAQLPGAVQASLKDEVILSTDAYLKGRRAGIRELEERITYLSGQKDLAATQKKQHETMRVEISEGITALQNEIAALAEKQFAGLDTAEMQERLVELSQRYDEMARDERGDTVQQQKELRALREKIVRRQSEQYQSKFTEPLAEITAKVNDLGARYKREAVVYKAFHAGMDCPTCHRRVTEETLPEVQAALKKAISELYAAGTEQKRQLTELQELDKKARDTFDAFKKADLRKWTEDAAELERRCAEQSETGSQAAESLRREIQNLTAELEYGNLTQAEYDRLRECREQCRELESKLSALNEMASAQTPDFDREIREAQEAIGKIKRTMTNVILYVSKRAELTFSQLKMNRVEISLYDVVKSTGEVKDTFKFTYSGRRYDRLSLSEKIRAGMEVSELIKRLTGRNYPVFVDNMESVDDLANVRPTGQIIMAKCMSNAPLQVRPIKPIVFAEQRAA